MRPVTDKFKATVSRSHGMVARARLCTAGQEGTNPGPHKSNGAPAFELSIVDGDVEFDPTAEIRASASVTVAASWPDAASSEFNPYGQYELFLERGVVYGDGSREWVSLGYYRLNELEQEDAPDGEIVVTAQDRMAQIIDDRLEEPRQYDPAASIRSVVEDLVHEVYPGLTVTLEGFDADGAIGSMHIVERERYAFLNEIAKSRGCTMFFDYDGAFVMKPVPESLTHVAKVTHGPGGVLVRLRRKISRDGVFNAVIAIGEQIGDAEPVRGVARDDSPVSPTRWDGPIGHIPRFYESSFLLTNDQAQRAAAAMLARVLGLPYSVDFEQVPNPALEPLDTVLVSYSDRSAVELHVLDRLSIPLVASRTMKATSRMQLRRG